MYRRALRFWAILAILLTGSGMPVYIHQLVAHTRGLEASITPCHTDDSEEPTDCDREAPADSCDTCDLLASPLVRTVPLGVVPHTQSTSLATAVDAAPAQRWRLPPRDRGPPHLHI